MAIYRGAELMAEDNSARCWRREGLCSTVRALPSCYRWSPCPYAGQPNHEVEMLCSIWARWATGRVGWRTKGWARRGDTPCWFILGPGSGSSPPPIPLPPSHIRYRAQVVEAMGGCEPWKGEAPSRKVTAHMVVNRTAQHDGRTSLARLPEAKVATHGLGRHA
jgi:hypothetical protein